MGWLQKAQVRQILMFLLAANIQGYCFKMIGMTTMLSHLLVWESKQWERHTIIKRITEYLLLRHLSLSERNIVHIVDQLDFSLVNGVGGKTSWWLPADSFWTFFLVCANLSKKKKILSCLCYGFLLFKLYSDWEKDVIIFQILSHFLEVCLRHLKCCQSDYIFSKTFLWRCLVCSL